MPVRERTSHEIPSKQGTASGLFVNHGGKGNRSTFIGETEVRHRGALKYATGNENKQKGVGGTKTLKR